MKHVIYIFLSLIFYNGHAGALVIGSDISEITIGANFSGQDLLVFGAFYSDPSLPRDAKGDVIIEVKGPPQTVQVRKKKSFYGFWLNSTEVTFREVNIHKGLYHQQLVFLYEELTLSNFYIKNLNWNFEFLKILNTYIFHQA